MIIEKENRKFYVITKMPIDYFMVYKDAIVKRNKKNSNCVILDKENNIALICKPIEDTEYEDMEHTTSLALALIQTQTEVV